MTQEAMKLALEAWAADLEQGRQVWIPAATLREAAKALAKQPAPVQQEPVAEVAGNYGNLHIKFLPAGMSLNLGDKLYATTPQRPWVWLTDEDTRLQWSEFWEAECHPWAIDFAKSIEAKLKEKNT